MIMKALCIYEEKKNTIAPNQIDLSHAFECKMLNDAYDHWTRTPAVTLIGSHFDIIYIRFSVGVYVCNTHCVCSSNTRQNFNSFRWKKRKHWTSLRRSQSDLRIFRVLEKTISKHTTHFLFIDISHLIVKIYCSSVSNRFHTLKKN